MTFNAPQHFTPRPGDLRWGRHNYPVTISQKNTLDGLRYMMSGLPKSHYPHSDNLPTGYFCSQRPSDGVVVIGLHHCSVNVDRNGRITSNERR